MRMRVRPPCPRSQALGIRRMSKKRLTKTLDTATYEFAFACLSSMT